MINTGQPQILNAADIGAVTEKKPTGCESKDPEIVCEDDFSPHAPNPNELWPPYGLLQSAKALTALGVSNPSECESIDDSTPVIRSEVQPVQQPCTNGVSGLDHSAMASSQPVPQILHESQDSFLAQRNSSSILVSPMFPGEDQTNGQNRFPGLNVNADRVLHHQMDGGITRNPVSQPSLTGVPIPIHIGGAPQPDRKSVV